jgi:hypothetical protein
VSRRHLEQHVTSDSESSRKIIKLLGACSWSPGAGNCLTSCPGRMQGILAMSRAIGSAIPEAVRGGMHMSSDVSTVSWFLPTGRQDIWCHGDRGTHGWHVALGDHTACWINRCVCTLCFCFASARLGEACGWRHAWSTMQPGLFGSCSPWRTSLHTEHVVEKRRVCNKLDY